MSLLCEIRFLVFAGLRIHRRLSHAATVFSSVQLPKIATLVTPNKITDAVLSQPILSSQLEILELEDLPPESLLTPTGEDLSHYGVINPTFNFAQYVNQSATLQNFIKLGVSLHKIEKNPKYMEAFLKLDFERDVKKYITFLSDYVAAEDLGEFITKNPMIFNVDLDDLQTRINYLESKCFNADNIKRIISRNPFWLMFSTVRIDKKLGYFQKEFRLTGNEVRTLASRQPKLITYRLSTVRINSFSLKEEMGFDSEQLKRIILQKPRLLMINQLSIIKTFNYFHLVMKIPHAHIVNMPVILTHKVLKVKERHTFLEKLGRAQYNCTKPNYIPLDKLVSVTDSEFCFDIAKCTLSEYDLYLKSI